MTAAAKKDPASGEPVAWENPLIPNKKLRALYVAMTELRLLDEHISRRRPSAGRLHMVRGEEGCRVSTSFDLKSGDLTSEGSSGVATSFLRGAKLADLVHRASTSGTNKATAGDAPGQLPALARTVDRLHLAIGAALALNATRKSALLIAYVDTGEATLAEWKPLLRLAAEQMVPMIFVVLPGVSQKNSGQLGLVSSKCGVPGIPVDAADPVALFRVAQESMLRARAGGGPVLMECIPFQLAGRKAVVADPIQTMQEFLLHRKIVDEAWLNGVQTRFLARLQAARS